jgi:glycosyltransferase involved in cell wall biosynthesis
MAPAGRASGDVLATTLIMSFNHADFIGQAVESALAQEVAGRYEILIADDCSTDGTAEIVRGYRDAHPERIRLLDLEENVGENAVRARGTSAARGRYVALLDGDDYWLAPDKLAKQVRFLETHPECAICFHNALVVYESGEEAHPFYSASPRQRISRRTPPEFSTLEELAIGNFMLTCAVTFRNGLISEFPDWYFEAKIPDWPFHVLNAEHGTIGYIAEVLSAYRVHAGGAWSDRISHLRDPEDVADIIWIHDAINRHLGYRYDVQTKRRTARLAAQAARLFAAAGRFEDAAAYACRSLSDAAPAPPLRERARLELLARPRLATLAARLRGAARRVARRSN